jgi:spore maturation protein CgeB
MLKIFKASDYYPSFQTYFYGNNPNIIDANYQTHISALFDFTFAESNFFKINIEKYGNAQVEEVISGDELLQKKWAKENNIKYKSESWFFEILEEQICIFKPDVFFAHHQKALNPEFIDRLKKLNPQLKLIISWDGIGNFDLNLFSKADILLTPLDSFTNKYISLDKKAYTLPFAFESSILDKLEASKKENISFIGSVHFREGGHRQRKELLKFLSNKIDIELYLTGSVEFSNNIFSKETVSILYNAGLQNFIDLFNLGRKSNGGVYGLEMYHKLFNTKIALNNHLDSVGNQGGNIRLFEATGCGACLLTDYKENLKDYFEIDKEVVVYKSPEECLEKAQFLLKNDVLRNEIALAGQKRTLENYNYRNRSLLFLDIINQNL